MESKNFDSLWQEAEVNRMAKELVREYPRWRRRRRTATAVVSVTLVAVLMVPVLLPRADKGYDLICCNRSGIDAEQWPALASDLLIESAL